MTKDEIVKTEIIAQAQKLFKQFGLKKTTMDEIAAACGKAKSTLYHYFKNKEEVFDEVLKLELLNIRTVVSIEVDKQADFINKIKTYFRVFHQETLNTINLFRILKQEIKSELIKSSRFNNVIDFEKKFLSGIILSGFQKGKFSELQEDDIPWFTGILLVAFMGIVRYSVESDGDFDEAQFDKIADVLIPRIFI